MRIQGLLIPDHDHLALLFHRLIPSKLALGLRPSLFRGMPTGKWIIRPYIATDLGGDYQPDVSFTQFLKRYSGVSTVGLIGHTDFSPVYFLIGVDANPGSTPKRSC